MTKTKTELKEALSSCGKKGCCRSCPYNNMNEVCFTEVSRDALEYIMQLELTQSKLPPLAETGDYWAKVLGYAFNKLENAIINGDSEI